MASKTAEVIGELAKELRYPEEFIMKESLKAFLERQLRQVKAKILQITGRYQLRFRGGDGGTLPGRDPRRGGDLARSSTA